MKLGLKCTAGLLLAAWLGLSLWACSAAAPRPAREPSATSAAQPAPTSPDTNETGMPPTAATTRPTLTPEQQTLVRALALAADQLQREGRYDEAANTCRRVLGLDAGDRLARLRLASAERNAAFQRAASAIWNCGGQRSLFGLRSNPDMSAVATRNAGLSSERSESEVLGPTMVGPIHTLRGIGQGMSVYPSDAYEPYQIQERASESTSKSLSLTYHFEYRPESSANNESTATFPDTVNSSAFYIAGETVRTGGSSGPRVFFTKRDPSVAQELGPTEALEPSRGITASKSMSMLSVDGAGTARQFMAPSSPDSDEDHRYLYAPQSALIVNGFDFSGYPYVSHDVQLPRLADTAIPAGTSERQMTVRSLLDSVRELAAAEHFSESQEILAAARCLSPEDREVTVLWGEVTAKEQQLARQRQLTALTQFAEQLESSGRYAEAEQMMAQAVQLDPQQAALKTRYHELRRKAHPLALNTQPGEELLVIARRSATTASAGDDAPGTGSLLAKLDGQTQPVPIPLTHTDVQAGIEGYIATVDVTQQYTNPFDTKIEAVYVFPLPTNAAINEFVMTVGDRRIRGIIREREQAQQIYAAAKAQGYVASLMTQERPNIFTQSVANIEPGKNIDISIRYFHTLEYSDGWYEFVFPMVVGPRYNPAGTTDGVGAVASDAAGTSGQATEVSYLRPNERSGHDIAVAVRIDAGVAIEQVDSRNHRVAVRRPSPESAYVELAADDTIPNKDFVLRYQVAGDHVKSGLVTYTDERGGFFTLMVYPPAQLAQPQRQPMEMIFVLDCSGSMEGAPLVQAKDAVQIALSLMSPDDTFQIIRFSDSATQFGPEPVLATHENVDRAIEYVGSLNSEGGTVMLTGIKAALDFPHDPRRVRTVAFLTDGFIGNDNDILREAHARLGDTRIFSFGVGSSTNRHLLDGLASFGHGTVAYLGLNDDAAEVMALYFERISHPALTDATIAWGTAEDGTPVEVSEVYPQRVPDLFLGRPIVLTGRFTGPLGRVPVQITGRVGTLTQTFEVVAAPPPAPQQMLAAKPTYVAPSATDIDSAYASADRAAGEPADDLIAYAGAAMDDPSDGDLPANAYVAGYIDPTVDADDLDPTGMNGAYAVAVDPDGSETTPDDGLDGAADPAMAGTQQAPDPGAGQRVPGPEFGADNPGTPSPANASAGGAIAVAAVNAAADDTAQHHGLPAVWARLKIADLSTRMVSDQQTDWPGEIRKVALEYGLLSSYTAFVAVDSLTRTAGEATTVAVPVPVPDGVSYDTTVQE